MFGCGAIGLGVIQTSSLVGASRVIAVDTNPGKESWAKRMGATDFVNPTQLPEGQKIQDYLIEITDGGLDYTFDATGNVCMDLTFVPRDGFEDRCVGECDARCSGSLSQGLGGFHNHWRCGSWEGDLDSSVSDFRVPAVELVNYDLYLTASNLLRVGRGVEALSAASRAGLSFRCSWTVRPTIH